MRTLTLIVCIIISSAVTAKSLSATDLLDETSSLVKQVYSSVESFQTCKSRYGYYSAKAHLNDVIDCANESITETPDLFKKEKNKL